MPLLEALMLLAQAAKGDASAAEEVAKRNFSSSKDDVRQGIEKLCELF